jgi:hypothetical protein
VTCDPLILPSRVRLLLWSPASSSSLLGNFTHPTLFITCHRLIPLLTFATTSLLRCPTLFATCHHLVLLLTSTTTSLLRYHLLSTTAPVGIWVPNHGGRSNSKGKGDVRIAGLAEDFPITKLLAFDFLMELYF